MFRKMLDLAGAVFLIVLIADLLDRMVELERRVEEQDANLFGHMETDDEPHKQFQTTRPEFGTVRLHPVHGRQLWDGSQWLAASEWVGTKLAKPVSDHSL